MQIEGCGGWVKRKEMICRLRAVVVVVGASETRRAPVVVVRVKAAGASLPSNETSLSLLLSHARWSLRKPKYSQESRQQSNREVRKESARFTETSPSQDCN